MRVCFFSKGGFEVVSSRYRCFYFAEALEENGIETHVSVPPPKPAGRHLVPWRLRELVQRARELAGVGRGDVAYFQRPIQNTLFVGWIALWKLLWRRRMVFDFCDPIFMHSPRKTRLLTRLADLVVVSGEDLARWARRHNGNVHVVPNSIKTGAAPVRSLDPGGRGDPVIGWAGSAKDHKDNLRLLHGVLPRLSREFRFRLIGARDADDVVQALRGLGIAVEAVDWVEPERAAHELSRFDIAVLPAEDVPWNRKLMTKLVDYMAAGLPVVASPVGENRLAIADGESGLLAAEEDDWVEKLDLLLGDAELRRRLGEGARRTVAERYSLAASGQRLAEILRRNLWTGTPERTGRAVP